MKRSSAISFGATMFLSPLFARAQGGVALETVRIGILPAEISGQIFYGLDRGIFAKNDLDLQVQNFTNGASIAAGVLSGSLDLGLSDLISITSAHSRGLPVGYVAPGLQNSEKAPTFAIVVPKNSSIRDAKDFSGKTFAVNGVKNISHIAVDAWIDNNGGDSKSVQFVEMPLPAMWAAIKQGTVQAGALNEPGLTAALADGGRVILMQNNGIAPIYLLSGWATTRAWASGHRGTIDKFARAIRETGLWANSNHRLSAPILAKYTKIPLNVVEHMYRGDFASRFETPQIQPMIDAAVKYGVIEKSFPAADLLIS